MSETGKTLDAFRTISEVAEELDLPQHVLRFWETRFGQIKPVKRAGGRRFYRPDDVDLLRGIRQLLYSDGYTIKGVQKILKDQGIRFVQDVGVERAAAVMRTDVPPPPRMPPVPEPHEGMTFGGLLGLLPRRRPKAAEDESLPALPKSVELPLPFPDAEADRDLAEHPEGPPAPFAPHARPEGRREPFLAARDDGHDERHRQREQSPARREAPAPRVSAHADPQNPIQNPIQDATYPRGPARRLPPEPTPYDESSYELPYGERREAHWQDAPRQDAPWRDPPPQPPYAGNGFPADAEAPGYDEMDEYPFDPPGQPQDWPPEAPAQVHRQAAASPRGGAPDPGRPHVDPSFAPLEGPARRPPVAAQRPSRGPAAHLQHHGPARELDDPLLPFMDQVGLSTEQPDFGSLSEPIEDRIRRLKAQAPTRPFAEPRPSRPMTAPMTAPMAAPLRREGDTRGEAWHPDATGPGAEQWAGSAPPASVPGRQADASYFDPAPPDRRPSAPRQDYGSREANGWAPGPAQSSAQGSGGARFVGDPAEEGDEEVFAPLARGRYAGSGGHGAPPYAGEPLPQARPLPRPGAAGFYGIPRVTVGTGRAPADAGAHATQPPGGTGEPPGMPAHFPAIVRRPVHEGAADPADRVALVQNPAVDRSSDRHEPNLSPAARVPPEPLRHGPPDQYLPPHLRAEPRLAGQAPVAAPVMSRDDVYRLQAALYELGECRRLMDDALDGAIEAAGPA